MSRFTVRHIAPMSALLVGVLVAAACLLPRARPKSADATPVLPGGRAITAADLRQKWQDSDRERFYFTSQGSELMPYAWFLSLESAADHTLFQSNLERFGFLPAPHIGRHTNPDSLPLGFVENKDSENYGGLAAKRWVGFTCAACHTGAFQYKAHPEDSATTVIVDGAPGHVDFGRFVDELAPAISETADDSAKFDRFATRVLGADVNPKHRAKLRKDYNLFAAQFVRFAQSRQSPVEWGPGRVDAFGMIFNRVCALNLDIPGNLYPADAPVNYPFLWNIPRQDHIQWHGEMPNKNLLDKMGRNVGEALGVFARVDINVSPLHPFYRSSVSRTGLLWLEKEVGKLGSPRWPEAAFGPINQPAAARGHASYNQFCARCHQEIPADPRQNLHLDPTPLNDVQTDPTMTVNFHSRVVKTGPLQGHLQLVIPLLGTKRFGPTALASDMVQNAVVGAIFYPRFGKINWSHSPKNADDAQDEPVNATPDEAAATYTAAVTADLNKIGYEARPLNGIWATAPYLHNGSVPSLWELLLPPERRLKTFYTGGWMFDPINVGYQTEAAPGSRLYDTALHGNHNSGHNYGAHMTDAQRRDLLEYLKTL